MKALELRSVFSGVGYDNEKSMQIHKENLKSAQKTVDNDAPLSLVARTSSPSKKFVAKRAVKDQITKENLLLARRIFNIMEGSSGITEKINDTKHLDNHPGTMNFKHRLSEAQRIHNRNMVLAARLDMIKPFYKLSDICVVRTLKKRSNKSANKKTRFVEELETALGASETSRGASRGVEAQALTSRSELPPTSSDYLNGFRFANSPSSQHARSQGSGKNSSESSRPKSHNVLLEYTKVQEGRVLDVAVIKEPFRDRYAIFGIDVDDGQRFELRLSSDDVSSILDGDILVTSVDNIEVWMALLNKVDLQPVETFAKMPFTGEEVDVAMHNNEHLRIVPEHMISKPITQSRPSTERPSSRSALSSGARSIRSSGANRSGTTSFERVGPLTQPSTEIVNQVQDVPASSASNSATPSAKPRGSRPGSRGVVVKSRAGRQGAQSDVVRPGHQQDLQTRDIPLPSPLQSTTQRQQQQKSPNKPRAPITARPTEEVGSRRPKKVVQPTRLADSHHTPVLLSPKGKIAGAKVTTAQKVSAPDTTDTTDTGDALPIPTATTLTDTLSQGHNISIEAAEQPDTSPRESNGVGVIQSSLFEAFIAHAIQNAIANVANMNLSVDA